MAYELPSGYFCFPSIGALIAKMTTPCPRFVLRHIPARNSLKILDLMHQCSPRAQGRSLLLGNPGQQLDRRHRGCYLPGHHRREHHHTHTDSASILCPPPVPGATGIPKRGDFDRNADGDACYWHLSDLPVRGDIAGLGASPG